MPSLPQGMRHEHVKPHNAFCTPLPGTCSTHASWLCAAVRSSAEQLRASYIPLAMHSAKLFGGAGKHGNLCITSSSAACEQICRSALCCLQGC